MGVRRFFGECVFWTRRATRLANAHGLDPQAFLLLSVLGTVIRILYYLPCFKGETVELACLVLLRFVGLVGPIYVLLKGKRIAAALNASLVAGWSLNTAWHVCYFVYL